MRRPSTHGLRHKEDHGHRECPDRVSFVALPDSIDFLFLFFGNSGKTHLQGFVITPHLCAFFIAVLREFEKQLFRLCRFE